MNLHYSIKKYFVKAFVIFLILEAPVLSPLPPTIDVPKGGKISFECFILDGNPKPDIVWLRNGQLIYPEYGIEVKGGKLEIIYAGESAEANYTCFASNWGGNATEETYVNVLCKLFSLLTSSIHQCVFLLS